MGGAAAEPSKSGRKSLDAPINLVPYIDLMTTIITFLMMTAVWTRIAALEVQNASGGNPPEEQEEEDKDRPKPIIVLLTDNAVKVQEEGLEMCEFLIIGEDYDFIALSDQFKAFKEARPERVEVKI
jgi:biopolymer transport protein ExbD